MRHHILVPLLALLCGCMSMQEKNDALLRAARTGDTATVAQMLKREANINAADRAGDTALLAAVKGKHSETARLLILSGANLNLKDGLGDNALLFAVKKGDVGTAALLVSAGADLNAIDKGGDTPLLAAVKKGDVGTAGLLVSGGADLNAKDRSGDTPLLTAIKKGDVGTAALLASGGADLNAKDKHGDIALNLAIKAGQHETAKLLVAKGANVNTKGALEDTPLHVSIYMGDSEMAGLLRSKGADESLLNNYGLAPSEMQALPEIEARVVKTAQILSPDGRWADEDMARMLYEDLKALQDSYLVNAIVLRVIRADDTRLRVLLLAIRLGIPGSEEKLGALLMVYGDKSMAEDYLNSGSSLLHDSGVKWAQSHGYQIQTGQGSHRSSWGRF